MTSFALIVLAVAITLAALLAVARRSTLSLESDLGESEQRRRDLMEEMAGAEHEREVFLQILNGLGEGLLAIDRDRRVVLANQRFAEMLGVQGELVGRPLGEVARIAAVFAAFDLALSGAESVESFTTPGLTERSFEVRAFPLVGQEIAAVGIFIDVTRLERLEQIRRDFVSDFSHEVRTPLAALKSAVDSYDVSGARMSAEEDQQLRRIMARQVLRLERLVDDLSELSGIESGELRLERTVVNLRRLLDDLCEDFRDRASQRSVRILVSGDSARVLADPGRIEQAFANLIDNALKYGGEGTIEIDVQTAADAAEVRISDHGEGIAPEEMQRIFRRFYRIDKSRSQDVAGTGLGLAITKHLVFQHGGTINVESEPGVRTTFIVMLPLWDELPEMQRHS